MRIKLTLKSKGIMAKERDFDDLWAHGLSQAKSRNGLFYHSCCDVWTSRGAEKSRSSHTKKLRWTILMASLKTTGEEEKKTLLRAKMTEEGWRLPAIMNQACKYSFGGDKEKKDRKEMSDEDSESAMYEKETQKTFSMPMASQPGLDR